MKPQAVTQVSGPGAGGIDHLLGFDGLGLSRQNISYLYGLYFSIADIKTLDRRIGHKTMPALYGKSQVLERSAKRIDAGIFGPVGGDDVFRKRGFHLEGIFDIHRVARNARFGAQMRKIRQVFFLQMHIFPDNLQIVVGNPPLL